MSAERNKAIVRRYLERLWGRGDAESADELIAADYVDHNPPPGVAADRAGLQHAVRIFAAAFTDLEISVEALIGEGDMVADRWSLRALHTGDFFGIPATGRRTTLTGLDLHRIVGGKIAETWHQEDIQGLLRQLNRDPAYGSSG